MQELRANTQVKVIIGPAVAVGDGFTPVASLDLSTADEAELFKHDAAAVTSIAAATFAAITSADGYYNLTLTTSLVDTEGLLTVCINDDSLILPIIARFMVLSEAAWDSKYVAKDDGFMDVNIKTVGRADTQETEASNLEAACAAYSATRGLSGTALPAAAADAAGGLPISDAGGLDLDAKIGALTFTTANKVDATVPDTQKVDLNTIKTNPVVNAGTVTFPTTATLASTTGAVGSVTGNVGGNVAGSVGSVTGAVGSVTGAVGSVTGNVGGNVTGSVGSVTGLTASDVAAIKVITDALTAAAAAKLALSAGQIITGTIDTTVAPSTTEFEADDITEATADHYNGRIVIFTSGVLSGQATSISDYAIAGGKGHFTVVAMTEAPGNNDTFVIV